MELFDLWIRSLVFKQRVSTQECQAFQKHDVIHLSSPVRDSGFGVWIRECPLSHLIKGWEIESLSPRGFMMPCRVGERNLGFEFLAPSLTTSLGTSLCRILRSNLILMQSWKGAALGIRGRWVRGTPGSDWKWVKGGGLLCLKTFLDKEKGKLPVSETKRED